MSIKLYAIDVDTDLRQVIGTIDRKPIGAAGDVIVGQTEGSTPSVATFRLDGSMIHEWPGSTFGTLSSNGRWLAYVSGEGQFAARSDGSEQNPILLEKWVVGIFNDGQRIIYYDDNFEENDSGLYLSKLDGTAVVRLTPPQAQPLFLWPYQPASLSADEKQLVYRYFWNYGYGLATVDLHNKSLRFLTDPIQYGPAQLTFSRDGKAVYYVDPGNYQTVPSSLHRLDLATLQDISVAPFSLFEVLLGTR